MNLENVDTQCQFVSDSDTTVWGNSDLHESSKQGCVPFQPEDKTKISLKTSLVYEKYITN